MSTRWRELRGVAAVILMALACKAGARASAGDAPERPPGVPEKAVWAGGVDGGSFILLSPTSSADRFSGKIFDDNTGEVVFSGTLKLDAKGGAPLNVADPKAFDAWDGDTLYLSDGRSLSPAGK